MNHLYKFRLKKVEAALRLGFRKISRYSRHLPSAEPDVGCVYHRTIQRWTISIRADSKKLKRCNGRTWLFQWGGVQLTFSMTPPPRGKPEELGRSIRVGAHLEYRCNLFQNVLRWSVEPPWTCLLHKTNHWNVVWGHFLWPPGANRKS